MGERAIKEHAATLAKKGMDVNMGVTKRPIFHGVLKCLECDAECETGPRILESTATAINIGKIFTCLMAGHGERPSGTSKAPRRLGPVIMKMLSSLNEGAFSNPSAWNAHT